MKDFISFVKADLKDYGVKCDLRKTKFIHIEKGIKGSGYFDESVPILVCAINRPDALEILVHEYSHFTQWRDKIPLWVDSFDGLNKVDAWLCGKRVHNIKRHIEQVQALELDNEKRAILNIKKFNIPIDLKHYHQKANAYLYFYQWLLISRRWSNPKNSPYKNKRLVSAMPDHFNNDYSFLPEKYRLIFEQEGI